MSLFNQKLKNITLKEIFSLIIILFLIQFFLNTLNIIQIDACWIYIFVIFFIFFKLRNEFFTIKLDILSLFSKYCLKLVLSVVILNIFLSYGLLYLSDYILMFIPDFNFGVNSIIATGLFSTIIISPISEELIFRGVILNRLKLVVPTIFSILISSLLFASLHSFGSIISAFIFAICMAILYLKTDNIFVPIFAHFLNNLFAEIIVVLDQNKILFTNELAMTVMSILAIVSFFLLLSSIIREMKILNNNKL